MGWGEILVGALIGTIIGAVALIISALITNIFSDRKISRKIGEVGNTTLAGQHESIENTIDKNTGQINKMVENSTGLLLHSTKDVLKQVQGINEKLIKEKADQENSFKNLDKDQQKIMEHIEGVHLLAKEWERTISRNVELEKKVSSLEEKVKKLTIELNNRNPQRGYGDEHDLEL